jgi:hypothetical protein
MKHRKFVVASTVVMFLMIGVVVGLALYSTVAVKASIPGLPDSVAYLPPDSQAVFGINVQKFIASPVYARLEQKHGQEIGSDLAEFIAKTGVDPRKDVHYIIASGRSLEGKKGTGVVIAEGTFNLATIAAFINTQPGAIKLEYDGVTVYMIPEKDGSTIEKGVALISDKEIALGELASLKAVLDIRQNRTPSVLDNPTLGPLIKGLNPDEMFWFAGDPTNVLAKAPANTPLGGNISSIMNVFGTLNLTTEVAGKITVTAKDEVSAGKLADVAKGLLALASLASDQNPQLAELLKGILIQQDKTQIVLKLNFPFELLDKLDQIQKPAAVKKVA